MKIEVCKNLTKLTFNSKVILIKSNYRFKQKKQFQKLLQYTNTKYK